MSEIDRQIKAQSVLTNPLYQEAYELCRLAIIDQIEKCPMSATEAAEDLRKCLRLLRDVRANMLEAVNAGKLVAFRIEQEKKDKSNPFKGLFR
jgi:hypothetical protein